MADFSKAGFSQHTLTALRQWFSGVDTSLTPIGEIKSQAPVKGRTEGIGTTVVNHNPDGTFNSLDNVHDGIANLRTPQFAGGISLAENGNFEAAATLPPPGWTSNNAILSYETVNPKSGNRSLIVNASVQFGSALAVRKYMARPGDAFRVTGDIMQAVNVSPAVQLQFLDKNGGLLGGGITAAISATGAWTNQSATGIAPAGTVSAQLLCLIGAVGGGIAEFDNVFCTRQATAFELTPINTAGTPRSTTGLVAQVGVTTAMTISSSIWQFGDGTPAYNTGSADPGALGAFTVTGDDPGFGGGAIPYIPRSTPADANAANGRLVFGNITTTGGGSVVSTGGGSGGGGPKSKFALV